MSELEKAEKELSEKIEQLLRSTDLSPHEIAQQLKCKNNKVYNHKAWPEIKELRRKKKAGTPEPPTSEPREPKVEFVQTKTEPTETPRPILATLEDQEVKDENAEAVITPGKIPKGSFKGILDTAFELLSEGAKLEKSKPNPVKIEKLDVALVDFCNAWQINFADPRVLPSIILAATIGEIGIPIVREIRSRPKQPKNEEPKTSVERAIADVPPPQKEPPISKATVAAVERALS